MMPATVKVRCAFHIGKPGTICRRCGVSWLEHYKPSQVTTIDAVVPRGEQSTNR